MTNKLLHADTIIEMTKKLSNDVSKTESYQAINEISKLLELVCDVFESDDQDEAISQLETFLR
jgi:hypothetical protein